VQGLIQEVGWLATTMVATTMVATTMNKTSHSCTLIAKLILAVQIFLLLTLLAQQESTFSWKLNAFVANIPFFITHGGTQPQIDLRKGHFCFIVFNG